ncbi:extensin-like domain-containing protein [Labrys neptuniae]
MRASVACLFLMASCSTALAQTAQSPLVPLPDYFQKSFAAAAAKPLPPLRPKPSQMRAVRASLGPENLPDLIMHGGVPMPPERPNEAATVVSAYAAETPLPPARPDTDIDMAGTEPEGAAQADARPSQQRPDAALPPGTLSHAFVPLPVRRPGGIDDRMSTNPGVNVPGPETKVAMLGAMPGAGIAINNLARLAPEPSIAKGSCSVAQPYRLMAIGPSSRTTLVPAATVDYAMVNGLVRWEAGMQAAAKQYLGENVVAIKVAASYVCRSMNNIRGAKLSEHAHGNAIDISGYITASGKEITVSHDFHGSGAKTAFLKQVHGVTCGVFQVVLGPGSDGYHEDHFHMDLGRWKSCR